MNINKYEKNCINDLKLAFVKEKNRSVNTLYSKMININKKKEACS